MTHKEIAKLIVDAEIRLHGRCSTLTAIQLKNWVEDKPNKSKFFTHEEILGIKNCALYIECYNAMVQEST